MVLFPHIARFLRYADVPNPTLAIFGVEITLLALFLILLRSETRRRMSLRAVLLAVLAVVIVDLSLPLLFTLLMFGTLRG